MLDWASDTELINFNAMPQVLAFNKRTTQGGSLI
jgi:hypothetical protein